MARVGPWNVYLIVPEHKDYTCRILHPTAQKNDETTIKVNDSISTQCFPFNNCSQEINYNLSMVLSTCVKKQEVLYKLF